MMYSSLFCNHDADRYRMGLKEIEDMCARYPLECGEAFVYHLTPEEAKLSQYDINKIIERKKNEGRVDCILSTGRRED